MLLLLLYTRISHYYDVGTWDDDDSVNGEFRGQPDIASVGRENALREGRSPIDEIVVVVIVLIFSLLYFLFFCVLNKRTIS